jgi:hypothetical protein
MQLLHDPVADEPPRYLAFTDGLEPMDYSADALLNILAFDRAFPSRFTTPGITSCADSKVV